MPSNREIFFKNLGLPSAKPMAIEVDHASGIYLYGKDGKDYIDLVSGVAVSNVGHLHPEVISAIKGQLDRYMHLMVYGEIIQSPQTKLAEKLTGLLPHQLNTVYFVNSGSEAIEGALKLAKRHTGKSEVIAFRDAYHGGTHGALSILGSESLKFAFRPLLPDIRHLRFNHIKELAFITGKTACVVVENIQAEAGIIPPDGNFLKALRNRCTETGAMLIIDDIQMGFGRTGKLFSHEHFDIVPDILVLAKAMGGGMPLGAFIASNDVMRSLTHNPELGHITTFGGHPVSCAAALAALNVITTENLITDAARKGKKFKAALAGHKNIMAIRQKGLMLGLDLESNEHAARLVSLFMENGLITDRFLFRPYAFRIAPPLTITDDEIEEAISRINTSLNQL
jgi:acetylornithine/succinyldiaminopimelate/putrescine aminotransferase